MRLGNTFFIALAIGALWGIIYNVVFSILAMLISGDTIVPDIGISMVSGAVGAGIYVLGPGHSGGRYRGWHWAAVSGAAALIAFVLLGKFAAASVVAENMTFLTALVTFAMAAASWHLCLDGMDSGSQGRYQLEVILIRVLKGVGFVFFSIVVALPFYVMVMTSLKSQQSLLSNPLDLSIDFSKSLSEHLRSYIELFTKYRFGQFLLNSAIVSVATVIITLLFAIPGAYAVSRLRFPGKNVLSKSILLIYMVPAIVLVIPLYAVFSQLGLRNTLLGLIVVYPATTIPVAVYMFQGYFRGLPYELEEAGLMDGLSRIGTIIKITLPLSLPAIASVSLYIFMIAWNEFLFAFMFLDDPAIFTLSRGVQSLNSSEIPRQHLMAGAVIATVPVLVLFLWFEKFLVAGLTAGSVKG